MKSTDEMILDLVARGFKLPPDIVADTFEGVLSFAIRGDGVTVEGKRALLFLSDQQAHDLCAMEFARQLVAQGKDFLRDVAKGDEVLATRFRLMLYGDSAAAIAALWEGTK